MANALSPTAANIISSLGIRGATATERLAGYVPILGPDGKLSPDFIPADAAQIAIPALSDVFYVDPYTDVAEGLRKGSSAAPFQGIAEAAERYQSTAVGASARRVTFLLAPGYYIDEPIVSFARSQETDTQKAPSVVSFVGLGPCVLNPGLSITGLYSELGNQPIVLFQNITTSGTVSIDGEPTVLLLGTTSFDQFLIGDPDATVGTLHLSSEARVGSTNAQKVFLADDAHVANTSTVDGETVKDALDRLDARTIRIAKITAGSTGFDVGSSYEDVTASSAGGVDVYDLSKRDRTFATAINNLLKSGNFTDLQADTVTATTVAAETIRVNNLKMDAFTLGGYSLEIDAHGYLVVADGSSPDDPPPDNILALRDIDTGAIYVLTVAGERLYLVRDDEAGWDSDSSSSDELYEIRVYDPDSGLTYRLYVQGGRLMIARI